MSQSIYTGRFNILKDTCLGALVIIQDNQAFYISADDYGSAIQGDNVHIQVSTDPVPDEFINLALEQGFTQKIIGTGKIESVLERPNYGQICGILQIKSSTIYGMGKNGGKYYLFQPINRQYPSFIVLSRVNSLQYKNHVYALIRFLEWNKTDKHPKGSCEDIIGEIGQIDIEIKARLYTNNLIFPQIKKNTLKDEIEKNIKMLNGGSGEINFSSCHERRDFCGQYVFSIDPEGCLDVDDAIHIEKTDSGYSLGIHIADVSAWIQPDSPLDIYAKKRMTSVYLPNETRHMLPNELSEGYCSLLQNQRRLTLSLILDVDESGQIKKWEFTPAIICNRRQMTYQQVENYLENPTSHNHCQRINLLYQTIQKINIHNQYYTYSKQEQSGVDDSPKAHMIVETCMVIANVLCAQHLVQKYGQCPLRIHSENDQKYFQDSMDYLKSKNYETPELVQLIKMKSNNGAQYQSFMDLKNKGLPIQHFGLNAQYYTHFTSPIRRYIDLVNHRLIKGDTTNLQELDSICENANDINKRVRRVGREILYLNLINTFESLTCQSSRIDSYAYITKFITKTPTLKIQIYLPEYQLTQTLNICHYRVAHLFSTEITDTFIKITHKETEQVYEYHLFSRIDVNLTPIINSTSFHKKLRIQHTFKKTYF